VTDTDKQIKRALSYPYERPSHSYLLDGEDICRLDMWEPEEDRIPVLACGSNAAPEQLIRKFQNHQNRRIPVTAGKLKDFVSVYSPHVAGYGAFPATIMSLPGITTTCHITWLTEAQLITMHQSEAIGSSYRYSELQDIELKCELTGGHSRIHAYVGLRGVLRLNGAYIGLAEIPIEGSHDELTLMDQASVQAETLKSINPENEINRFIIDNLDLQRREQTIEALTSHTAPYPPFSERIIHDKKLDD